MSGCRRVRERGRTWFTRGRDTVVRHVALPRTDVRYRLKRACASVECNGTFFDVRPAGVVTEWPIVSRAWSANPPSKSYCLRSRTAVGQRRRRPDCPFGYVSVAHMFSTRRIVIIIELWPSAIPPVHRSNRTRAMSHGTLDTWR